MDKKKQIDPLINKTFFGKYVLVKKLGEGSFGSIYLGKCGEEEYALKFETRIKGQNLLESEAYIMSYLKGTGIPLVKSYGYSGEYNILVMELLGKSLEDLFNSLPKKLMSIRCVCNIGFQMIDILEYVHKKHIIHRDIKPDNFLMGINAMESKLYLLDFGLAKKYRSSSTLKHYPMIMRKNLTGTARYASINALRGYEQSRRDDLEAVGYVLMYFLRGSLPWQGLPVKNKDERYIKIMEKKRDTTEEELCTGFPEEFQSYIKYTRNLEYEQDPDYDYLKSLFISVLNQTGNEIDYYYDWSPNRENLKKNKDNEAIQWNEERLKEKEIEGDLLNPKTLSGIAINFTNNINNKINHMKFKSKENILKEDINIMINKKEDIVNNDKKEDVVKFKKEDNVKIENVQTKVDSGVINDNVIKNENNGNIEQKKDDIKKMHDTNGSRDVKGKVKKKNKQNIQCCLIY